MLVWPSSKEKVTIPAKHGIGKISPRSKQSAINRPVIGFLAAIYYPLNRAVRFCTPDTGPYNLSKPDEATQSFECCRPGRDAGGSHRWITFRNNTGPYYLTPKAWWRWHGNYGKLPR
jgi:hypothetical protein